MSNKNTKKPQQEKAVETPAKAIQNPQDSQEAVENVDKAPEAVINEGGSMTPEAAPSTEKPQAAGANLAASIRNQPTDEQIAELRKETLEKSVQEVKVKTVSGGDMWDPDVGAWIGGRPTLAMKTPWLERQVKAGKVTVLD